MNIFPKISVITPSLNQARFLEQTILSVLGQEYPNLEYIIIDGGSTDGSVDIIRQYEDQLAYWVSEPDRGQSDAINKGLRIASGEWVGWQNSDDIYCPGAFHHLALAAEKNSHAELIVGDMMLVDEAGVMLREMRYIKPNYRAMLAEGMLLANQSAFWKRGLHTKLGFMDEGLQFSFDYEWFLRVTQYVEGVHVGAILGALRLHDETKTSLSAINFQEENRRILAGRELSVIGRWGYKLRRLFLMLCSGHFRYVLRGLWVRLRGKAKELC